MTLFKNQNEKISIVKDMPFSLEKDLQKLTEKNIREIFGLEFVSSEFQHNDLRIDTLAFDRNLNTFVVLEYKREKSFSVIDQGFAYLSLILNNQAEFVLEFNKKFEEKRGKADFDWSQMRVLFLTRSFTPHQLEAINFKDLPIELWEVTRYEGDLIQYSQVKKSGAKASIESLGINNNDVKKVSREVKTYSEEDYLNSKPDGVGKKIFELLKEKVLVIDSSIVMNPTKSYISFQLPNNWRNIFYCHVYGSKLKIDFTRSEPKDFNDPEKKVFYNENSVKHYNQHISYIEIDNEKGLDYGLYIIQQAYDKFMKEN
ncbi:MAG: Transporter [Parcubacteria bacterium C7867-006]|nr:MAG: Transporter [Parcubacteria bacterium C7867-006]